MTVDKHSNAWSEAHEDTAGFYAAGTVNKAYLLRQMRHPLVKAVVSIGKTTGRRLRVLEIGCGSGIISICIALRGHVVTTIDISEYLLAQARERAVQVRELYPHKKIDVTFQHGDLFEPQTYAGEYDVVVSNGVIIIWKDRAKQLEGLHNLRSVLVDRGHLVLGTTNTLNPLFKLIPVTDIVADLAEHNLQIIEDEARDAGFVVEQRGTMGISEHFEQYLSSPLVSIPLKIANTIFENLPEPLRFPLAPHVYIVARKV